MWITGNRSSVSKCHKVVTRFANLGGNDEYIQLRSICWHLTFHNYYVICGLQLGVPQMLCYGVDDPFPSPVTSL